MFLTFLLFVNLSHSYAEISYVFKGDGECLDSDGRIFINDDFDDFDYI